MPDTDSADPCRGGKASDTPVFDPRVLSDMFGEDKAIVTAVLETFTKSMTATLTELRAAMAQTDGATVISLAHKIKGVAQMSGALALAQSAVDLEQAARAGGEANLMNACSLVDLQWTRLRNHSALNRGADIGDDAA